MKSREIRDRHNKLVGTIYFFSEYQTLRNRHGVLVGTYYTVADITRDRKGRLVGQGNLLTTLL